MPISAGGEHAGGWSDGGNHEFRGQSDFGELYELYFASVHASVCRILHDPHEAESVAHEAFAVALESLSRADRQGMPTGGWVFATARNLALKHRHRHRRVEVTTQEALGLLVERLQLEVEDQSADRPDPEALWDLVARLPRQQRRVLELRFAHDLTPAEVAEALACTRAAVDCAQHRALATLRLRFQHRRSRGEVFARNRGASGINR